MLSGEVVLFVAQLYYVSIKARSTGIILTTILGGIIGKNIATAFVLGA